MAELIHVLIVSKNQTLKRNVDEWFFSKIEAGKLKIDFSDSRKSAEEMMSSMSYDKIFHNGIYVIDAIERLQVGADVYAFGKTNNNLNNYIENPHDKKVFSKIFSRKYLKLGVNIGGALGSVVAIITGLVLFVAFGLYARSDIDINTEAIVKVDGKVDNLEVKVDENGVVSRENNIILKIIYNKEIEMANNKSTIGD